jgi:two-component system nitrate/nitrite response regulator NarL
VRVSSVRCPVSLLIIAPNRLLRDGIADLLNEQPDLTAVAAAPAWGAVHSLVFETKPRLILLDSCLGPQYSMRLLDAVKDARPTPQMIVMDLIGEPEEVVEFVEAGCSGLILKDATLEHFITTIRSVAQGVSVLPATLTETIFSHVVRRAGGRGTKAARQAVVMTPREREVMALIAEGRSNKEIAERLHIAVHTVKSHVHIILEKLALHTRLEIAAYTHRRSD